MDIKIDVFREWNSVGDLGFRVVGIKALRKDQLPLSYLNGRGCVIYLDSEGEKLCLFKNGEPYSVNGHGWTNVVRRFYSAGEMALINAHIRMAADNLSQCLKFNPPEHIGDGCFINGQDCAIIFVWDSAQQPEI